MRPIVAKDLMTTDILTVEPELTIEQLATFLIDNEISGAPVMENGRAIGVVSLVDVAAATSEQNAPLLSGPAPDYYARGWEIELDDVEARRFRAPGESRTVRDIMSRAVYAVEEETPISDVAEIMVDAHLHRLLVLRDGEVVGLVAASDLLGLLIDDPT